MSRIDRSSVDNIFRVLLERSTRQKRPEDEKGLPKTKVQDAVIQKKEEVRRRDINELQRRLKLRLLEVDPRERGQKFVRSISKVMIQEIMHWEFGDDILIHAEYSQLLTHLVDELNQSSNASAGVVKIYKDITGDGF